ncbi:MAG: transglutaminase-like domain-containing protein [Deltaproteobacteria bacterium]
MKRRSHFFIAGCSAALAFGLILVVSFCDPIPRKAAYPIPRQIQYSFTLQNRTNQTLKNAEFWAQAPVKETANQRCECLEVSHPYQLQSDEHGNQTLYFNLPEIPPFATVIISVQAFLSLSDTPNELPASDLNSYLHPEPFCESDAPEITRLAATLRSGKLMDTVDRIFNWVTSNVQYAGYIRNERGALYALKNKQGDCTEFMYLFAALCRASQIPSRTVGGYVCSGNTVVKPGDYHNWAEFFDGKRWRIADPQRKILMKETSNHIAMQVIADKARNPMAGFQRFRFFGEGLKVKMDG